MPSGRVHEAINLSVLGVASAGYIAYKTSLGIAEPVALAFSASYLVGTFLVTPDLDLAENRVRAKGRWGVLGLFWVPYGLMFSHRGLSHTWLAGPITRVAYMGLVGLLLYWVSRAILGYVGVNFNWGGHWQTPPENILWALVLGYYVSQWLHLLADGVWPDADLRFARRRRR